VIFTSKTDNHDDDLPQRDQNQMSGNFDERNRKFGSSDDRIQKLSQRPEIFSFSTNSLSDSTYPLPANRELLLPLSTLLSLSTLLFPGSFSDNDCLLKRDDEDSALQTRSQSNLI
jgi:hypothetical protein